MTKAFSQNGYTANDVGLTQSYKVPGTDRALRLVKGAPGELLVHWAQWFHNNIEPIDAGQLDDWGYAERPIRGSSTTLSNHASGTAEDLNATRHPLGKRGTFTSAQTAKIRDRLKQYDGCIRWGGDYTKRADEMHFEIVKSPAECAAVLARLTTPSGSKPTPPANAQEEWTVADVEAVLAAIADLKAYQKACTIQIQDNTQQNINNAVKALMDYNQKMTVAGNNYTRQIVQGTDAESDAQRQAEADKLRDEILAALPPVSTDVPEGTA